MSEGKAKKKRSSYQHLFEGLDEAGHELLREVGETVIPLLLEQAIREGRIDPRDKTQAELNDEFERYLHELIDESHAVTSGDADGEILVVFDYTTVLLREARRFAKEGKNDLACLFYATWLEHWLNQMIVTGAGRGGLHREEITQMIRELPLRAKVSWVFPALGLPRLAQAHQSSRLSSAICATLSSTTSGRAKARIDLVQRRSVAPWRTSRKR